MYTIVVYIGSDIMNLFIHLTSPTLSNLMVDCRAAQDCRCYIIVNLIS